MKNRKYEDFEDLEDFEEDHRLNPRAVLIVAAAGLCVLVLLAVLVILLLKDDEQDKAPEIAEVITDEIEEDAPEAEPSEAEEEQTGAEAEDPQSVQNAVSPEAGAQTEITEVLVAEGAAETDALTIGIDVSRFQGTIDWAAVAETGIDFAIIRVGYRTQSTGEIVEDTNARYNLQEAAAHGIQIGAYFFSTAVSGEEAAEEARWVAELIASYPITYPVAYNCEGFENPENRQYELTKTQRTDIAVAFLEEIYDQGYTPMFYASKSELEADAKWETSRLEQRFKIWVSQYPAQAYPQTPSSSYSGIHDMWQYTNNGALAGITEPVDVNVAYFGYTEEGQVKGEEAPQAAEADVEALMNFREVSETVTAKEVVNLRDIPSQGEDSTVLRTLANGENVTRTGISDSGWSRLEIDGTRFYAVSTFLTTDLTYQPPKEESDDGLKTKFTKVSENVTPKIEVNLRKLPSVTNPDATVVTTVTAGEVFVRTGINTDVGWSRVEYNGQVLYCVSSYLNVVEEQ